MAANNEYKQTGWDKRKTAYTLGVVIGAIVLATLIVLGFITLQQVEEYTELVIYLVGFLGGLGYLINSALARKNVEPPAIEPGPDSYDLRA